MEEKETMTINKDNKNPNFKVMLWDEDKYDMEKKYKKRMWSGKITHIKSGEMKFFEQVSEMLKFMEDHRVE